MSSNLQINRSMARVEALLLQNWNLTDGITTIVNDDNYISDLLLADNLSDIQTFLASNKTIMDSAIDRGYTTMDVSGGIYFNYDQLYNKTMNTKNTVTIYQTDLSFFYKYDASATNYYTPKTNVEIYNSGAVSNSTVIQSVTDVIDQTKQTINLIADIQTAIM